MYWTGHLPRRDIWMNPKVHIERQTEPLLIVGALCLVYLNSLWGAFQFDDGNVILGYPAVHSIAGWLHDLGSGIRPLLKLTYMLNWICEPTPFNFHLVNIAVHTGNSILVYLLAYRFTERASDVTTSASRNYAPLLTGLLFALHPVQTEAVTYISGRSTSLMALFYLGSLFCYVYGIEKKKPLVTHLFSPMLFVLAVATKETALTLPLALLLWETSYGRFHWRSTARRQVMHWIMFFGTTVFIMVQPNYNDLLVFSLEQRTIGVNALSQINGVSYLLSHLVRPWALNIDPDLPVLSTWSTSLVCQFSFLLGVLVLALWTYKKRPWISFGILWFFVQLLPTNSIIPRLDVANDRQLYLASFGLFLSIAVEIQWWQVYLRRWDRPMLAAVGIVLILLGAFTVMRNRDYRSEVALWEDTAGSSPHKARVFNNLGVAYERAGLPANALQAYSRALLLNPDYEIARKNIDRFQMIDASHHRNLQ